MSKKLHKSPEVALSRQLPDTNHHKVHDIKQLSTTNKKPIPQKNTLYSKNSQQNPTPKTSSQDSQPPENLISVTSKSRVKENSNFGSPNQLKSVKKAGSPLSSSESMKKFPKTSKVPTLCSTAAKGTSDESQGSEVAKNIESKIFIEESSVEANSMNLMTTRQSNAISMLQSSVQSLKVENEDLKKQNEKLSKKLEKLRSLNDENKKLLKERIQNFNSEGESLRKLRGEMNQLEEKLEEMKEKVVQLESQNAFLKENYEKINAQKISKEVQTLSLQEKPEKTEKNGEKRYHSSSSRNSYGGILPLETVVKLGGSKIQINFRTDEITPRKNQSKQPKLMDKYENYWSEKFEKQPKSKNVDGENEAKSENTQGMDQKCAEMDQNQQNEFLDLLQLETIQKQRINGGKNCNQVIESAQMSKKEGFSPTILVENYRKISEQDELIHSLYRVIEELSKEIEIIQKREDQLIQENRELKIKCKKLTIEKDTAQKNSQEKGSTQEILEQLKDDTLLLDQSKENEPNETINLQKGDISLSRRLNNQYNKLLRSAERINQLLIFDNYEPMPFNEEKVEPLECILKIQSAKELGGNSETRIIDEISRFWHSELVHHESFEDFMENNHGNTMHNKSFEGLKEIKSREEKFSDNRSSTKEEEPFKNFEDLDRQIIAGTAEYSSFKNITKEMENLKAQIGLKDSQEIVRNTNEMKIEDSLDALEYFSDSTPENIDISQNVSGLVEAVSKTKEEKEENPESEQNEGLFSENFSSETRYRKQSLKDQILDNEFEQEPNSILASTLIRVEEPNSSASSNI